MVDEAFSWLNHRPAKSFSVTMLEEALVYLFHSDSNPAHVVVEFQKYSSVSVAQRPSIDVSTVNAPPMTVNPVPVKSVTLSDPILKLSVTVVVAFNVVALKSSASSVFKSRVVVLLSWLLKLVWKLFVQYAALS